MQGSAWILRPPPGLRNRTGKIVDEGIDASLASCAAHQLMPQNIAAK
jgi:hypothetical protein